MTKKSEKFILVILVFFALLIWVVRTNAQTSTDICPAYLEQEITRLMVFGAGHKRLFIASELEESDLRYTNLGAIEYLYEWEFEAGWRRSWSFDAPIGEIEYWLYVSTDDEPGGEWYIEIWSSRENSQFVYPAFYDFERELSADGMLHPACWYKMSRERIATLLDLLQGQYDGWQAQIEFAR